jgi:UDP-sugar pyrophosphorylase
MAKLSEEDFSKPPFSQEHLFEGASPEIKAELVKQLNEIHQKLPGGGLRGYLDRARLLLADAQSGKNPFEGKVPKVPSGERLSGADRGPGSERYAQLELLGMKELARTSFCLVAGGLGERLGYPGIKIGITSEVTTGASFMQTFASFILAFQAYARETTGNRSLELPLAIMTSGDTHQLTLDLLQENRNFGLSDSQVTLMKQEKVPALLDVDARISAKDGMIETKPHGHGDVHALLHQTGLAQKWADAGIEWLVVFQDTNPLPFRTLCGILGVSVSNSFLMNSVTVPRIPCEAIGGIATLEDAATGDSLTINVEYNQLDPLLKTTPTGGDVADDSGFSPFPGNINILVFHLPRMCKRLDTTGGIVSEFVNPKWADEAKTKFKSATRLECMMQDFPKLCSKEDMIGFTQLDRSMCFTCVKNNLSDAIKKTPPDCALSAEADIYACNARLLQLAGADVQIEAPDEVSFLGVKAEIGARIVLHPEFGISLEQMKTRVKGKIKISKRSTLIIDGPATLDGLDLDGGLKITGTAVTAGASVRNAGTQLVAIPEKDLPTQEPSLQIRGYRQDEGYMEILA